MTFKRRGSIESGALLELACSRALRNCSFIHFWIHLRLVRKPLEIFIIILCPQCYWCDLVLLAPGTSQSVFRQLFQVWWARRTGFATAFGGLARPGGSCWDWM